MFCNKNKISIDNLDGIRETVRGLVKEKRYTHILGVEGEAVRIAEIFGSGEDFIKKLRAAALLHDITKEFDMKKQLEICGKYNIEISEDDIKAVKPLHAKTGAYIAKIEFGADSLIFNGIYNHTAPSSPPGKFGFDLFGKIIYLADWTEPNRDFPECIEIRDYFYSRIDSGNRDKAMILDKTLLLSYNKTIEILVRDGLFIHEDTVKCRNNLIIKEITV